MSSVEGSERCLFGKYAKQQSKYGSTSTNVIRKEKHIQHIVQPTDTLQGLALRYGVTMEDIKRVNKLWTTDSLFLRPSLLIPVPNDFMESPASTASNTPTSSPSKGCYTDISLDVTSPNSASRQLCSLTDTKREQDESVADFLIRIDSSIAQTKDKVMLLEQTNTVEEESYPRSWRSQHHSVNGFSRNVGASDPAIAPHPVVMTQGRKVRSSLKRLEQEQDELFQL